MEKKAGCDGISLSSQLLPEVQIGNSQFRLARQKARAYLQNNQSQMAGIKTQAVEGLPSKCKTLSSNPSGAKKQNQKEKSLKQ
jgi:hypothetical protein